MTMSEITVSRTERHKCTNICPENIQNDNRNGAIRNNKTQKQTGKTQKDSELLIIPEIFRKIYCFYSASA